MTKCTQAFDLDHAPGSGAYSELIFEVQRGLLTWPRSLAPWIFYDELGSGLFERITNLTEYYLTRTESSMLAGHADAIIAEACARQQPLRTLELGAGTVSKTAALLEARSA